MIMMPYGRCWSSLQLTGTQTSGTPQAGRTGSFMFHHNAGAGLEGGLSLTVTSGSGTGQLAGLQGSARIETAGQVGDTSAPDRLTLNYRPA